MSNDFLVLVTGASTTGKSACLRNLKNPEGVLYANTEANKRLPFKAKFKKSKKGTVTGFNIVDPLQLNQVFVKAEGMADVHTIVVDSVTYLMDAYETQYVLTSANTMKAWGEFAQFFKVIMQQHVASSSKVVIMTAHSLETTNEEGDTSRKVPVKGALKNNGIESYFSMVISTKKMRVKDLEKYDTPANKLLNITPKERSLGFKYCFQTMITQETYLDSIRGPMGMWGEDAFPDDPEKKDYCNETFIDNDIQLVIDRLHEYYDE